MDLSKNNYIENELGKISKIKKSKEKIKKQIKYVFFQKNKLKK